MNMIFCISINLGIQVHNNVYIIYYPLEVRRGKYWGLGVFTLQYFPLVNI